VLVVGAGGIGTYLCLNLALMGIEADIYDGDVIDKTNLNRQVFYYERIGKPKASTLAERLNTLLGCRLNAIDHYVTKDIRDDYGAILGCVDNPSARSLINEIALRHNIPLIDAGVTAFDAKLQFYVPSRSICLSCKNDYSAMQQARRSCATAEPNVVMCNALAGAMLAAELNTLLYPCYSPIFDKVFFYSSKRGAEGRFMLRNEKAICNGKDCVCHTKLRNYHR